MWSLMLSAKEAADDDVHNDDRKQTNYDCVTAKNFMNMSQKYKNLISTSRLIQPHLNSTIGQVFKGLYVLLLKDLLCATFISMWV